MRPALALPFFAFCLSTLAQELTDDQIWNVRQRLADSAQASWEKGTRAQTIIEYEVPEYNVLSKDAVFPPPPSAPSGLSTPLEIARQVIQSKPGGIKPLFADGSVADPASLGVVVLIANWTGQRDGDYAGGAASQLDYLLNDAPRADNGAISHRSEKTQLWSDFIYMVPPFLAYYGGLQGNTTLMDEAYTQISLYRDKLHDPNANNLWKHIVEGGSGEDQGHWSTGNGWAAMGMLRVMGTYRASPYSDDYSDKQSDLLGWVEEIVEGMYSHTQDASSALFRNYPDQDNSFYDASSTALIAAATYRLATLTDGRSANRIPDAERARKELSKNVGAADAHIDGQGWLSPVVDPHNFPIQGTQSAEGQAFVVSMQAAYRNWKDAGSPGESAAMRNNAVGGFVVTVVFGLVAFMVGW